MKVIEIKHVEGNACFAVEEAMRKIVPGEPTLIRFEKGIYRFQREGSRTDVNIHVGYLAKTRKYVLFALENLSDVTIDGNGSEFLFMERMFPFYLCHCRNVTLKNFTIDFDCSMLTQGTVVSSDNAGFELKIDSSLFRYRVDEEGHVIFICGKEEFSTEGRCAILLGNAKSGLPPWDYIFAGSTQADMSHLPTGFIWTDAEKTAEGIYFRYRKDSRVLRFTPGEVLFFNYMPRENINILTQLSSDIRLENITMYRGGGMGFVAEYTRNLTIDGACIMVRPGRAECRSTTADGMFFTQCSGQFIVRNSKVCDTLDDALNIHGFYTKIVETDGKNLVLEYVNPSHRGYLPYAAGDRIMINDPETQNCKAVVTIASAVENPVGTCRITLKEDASAFKAGDIVENETQAADFLYENNELVRIPHLRISDNGKLHIRNNRFREIQSLYFCDLMAYWFECGSVHDVLVENNEFVDSPSNGEYAVFVESSRKAGTNVRNENIRILNNRFIGGPGRNIRVQTADHVTISGNQYACVEGVKPVEITDCTDVKND